MKRSKGYRVVAPDRYLRVLGEPRVVTVRHDGELIARSERAIRLVEGDSPEVLYVPREDVDAWRLVLSGKSFHCRWKGDAVYYHVDLRDRTLENVVWGYPDAPESVVALRERIAFDPTAFEIRAEDVSDAGPPGWSPSAGAMADGEAAGERSPEPFT